MLRIPRTHRDRSGVRWDVYTGRETVPRLAGLWGNFPFQYGRNPVWAVACVVRQRLSDAPSAVGFYPRDGSARV